MNLQPLNQHINLNEALVRLVNDENLLIQVLKMSVDEFLGCVREFEDHILASNSSWLKQKAHYFKGGAANLSAHRLYTLLASLEESSSQADSAAQLALLGQIKAEVNAIKAVVDQITG